MATVGCGGGTIVAPELQQQQQEALLHGEFLLKLRAIALTSVQNLLNQQQQPQQQQHRSNIMPRMCGVMDWLVRFCFDV